MILFDLYKPYKNTPAYLAGWVASGDQFRRATPKNAQFKIFMASCPFPAGSAEAKDYEAGADSAFTICRSILRE